MTNREDFIKNVEIGRQFKQTMMDALYGFTNKMEGKTDEFMTERLEKVKQMVDIAADWPLSEVLKEGDRLNPLQN